MRGKGERCALGVGLGFGFSMPCCCFCMPMHMHLLLLIYLDLQALLLRDGRDEIGVVTSIVAEGAAVEPHCMRAHLMYACTCSCICEGVHAHMRVPRWSHIECVRTAFKKSCECEMTTRHLV